MSTIDLSKIAEIITTGLINLIADNIAVLITGILTYIIAKFEMRHQTRQWERELKLKEKELSIQEREMGLKEKEINSTLYLQRIKLKQEQLIQEKELKIKKRELELREKSLYLNTKYTDK